MSSNDFDNESMPVIFNEKASQWPMAPSNGI